MIQRDRFLIGGEWRAPEGSERAEVRSPATGEVIGTVPVATTGEIDAAAAAARVVADAGEWAGRSPDERAAGLARLRDALAARTDELADLASSEIGTPRTISPLTQVGMALGVLDTYEHLTRLHPWTEDRAGRGGHVVRVRRLPVGVVGAIVPWNAPLFSTALKVAPALGAGNAVVLKPAELAPLWSFVFAEAVAEADLPPGLVNVVPGGAAVGEHLTGHEGVDEISFTGSTAVGRQVAARCAADLRRCTLELGGRSAAVVLDDVELDPATVAGLLLGFTANAGQVCTSQTRVLVPRARHDEVVDALVAAAEAVVVGDPFDPATTMGPLVSQRQRDRIEAMLADATAAGATIATGGTRGGTAEGWFLRPTVVTGAEPDDPIATEELFGPVAVVLPHDGDDDAVRLANDSRYGLAGRVWTADPERGAAVAARLQVGSASLNLLPPVDLAGPFGGWKDSGIGREGGPEGFAAYVEEQTLVLPA